MMKKNLVLLSVFLFVSVYPGEVPARNGAHSFGAGSQLSVLGLSPLKIEGGTAEQNSPAMKKNTAVNLLAGLPLCFEENKGQVDNEVRFLLRQSGMNAYFASDEIVYQFILREGTDTRDIAGAVRAVNGGDTKVGSPGGGATKGVEAREGIDSDWPPSSGGVTVENVRMIFLGMNEGVIVEGVGGSETRCSYFIGGDPEKWITGAGTFKEVLYRNLYPGINLAVKGERGRIKQEYRLRVGARIEDIRIEYEGIQGVRVNAEGELEFALKSGIFKESAPVSYQLIDGERKEVRSGFRIIGENVVGFLVDRYHRDYELVLDPGLSYSTYLGGGSTDVGYAIALDGCGSAYVTGKTWSADFPTTAGAFDTDYNGGSFDIFVTKVKPSGAALSYSTYLGGAGDFEEGLGIAVDASGNAYVTGSTDSEDFPVKEGSYDTTQNGSTDAFVTKLNPSGSALIYSTFLGGSLADIGRAVEIDSGGNAYVAGYAASSNFPTSPGAYDTSNNGGRDVFVAKLDNAGANLVYSTYLGGESHDEGRGLAVDKSGNTYVTGWSQSADYPITAGAYDETHNGQKDAIVTKLNPVGTALEYSTYLGGSGDDDGYGIALQDSQGAHLTGITYSADFPTNPGAFDTSFNGGDYDAFISKVNAAGSDLSCSTFLGGSGYDGGYGIDTDRFGNTYVTGFTRSADFPTTPDSISAANAGGRDLFISRLASSGSSLSYSSYFGGSADDYGYGIALADGGDTFVTGYTWLGNYPTTAGAFDVVQGGLIDAFVTKFYLGGMEDLLGTWTGQGVYCRVSGNGGWRLLASPASKVESGDLDDDGIDDLIGIWPGQGGVWAKYSGTEGGVEGGDWVFLSSTADWIGAGDMNGDGRDDFLGTWSGQGVYYKDLDAGEWTQIASPATQIDCGNMDGDAKMDLIGIWPGQGGVWAKYSSGGWIRLSSTADWIGAGDMNGDSKDDLVGSWTGQGVFYRDSETELWVKMATAATQITCGDMDGDGVDDLIGIWAGQGGVWVKYSDSGTWQYLSSTADWIACGQMQEGTLFSASAPHMTFVQTVAMRPRSLSGQGEPSTYGPGERNFVCRQEGDLIPAASVSALTTRIPGPGEPGFTWTEQPNLIPCRPIQGQSRKIRHPAPKK